MKKIFLFAIAAATMAVGCQKIQDLVRPDDKPVDEDSPVEIKFTTNVATVETKAGVGALDALSADHVLYVYGLNRTSGKRQITNAPAQVVVAAGATAEEIGWLDENLAADPEIAYFYNGTVDMYDFYGYYVGDAAGENPLPGEDYELNVTIDGQHDILLAKAEGVDGDQSYSGKTARAGDVPNLAFNHQLAKFTFAVRNQGNTDITLTDVKVNTLTKGVLTVANATRGGSTQGLKPTPGTEDDLDLPNDELPLPAKVNDSDSFLPVKKGANQTSLMVFPGQETYNIDLYLTQTGVEGSRVVTVPFKYNSSIAAGSAYALQITVYSLTDVKITATLVAWNPVVVPEIDTEDYAGVKDSEGEEETPTPTFSIDVTERTVAATGESFDVTVTPEEGTTVGAPTSSETWATVEVGGAENVWTVTVEEYTGGVEARTATITFTDDAETTQTLTITQNFE